MLRAAAQEEHCRAGGRRHVKCAAALVVGEREVQLAAMHGVPAFVAIGDCGKAALPGRA
eukprot:CAMPEP_0179914866 /NCGR_PEP_ID=MMETSP0983-20121128/1339_1 /TAXON_ID=483367 /ORGANISM="non described non described, Strain CCMP 2436" /LENGTH=58 /DNA_ID=CAMNT_0021817185 /DNA_START=367 /DNA_END=543 /DNA_ORIENTATION=+